MSVTTPCIESKFFSRSPNLTYSVLNKTYTFCQLYEMKSQKELHHSVLRAGVVKTVEADSA